MLYSLLRIYIQKKKTLESIMRDEVKRGDINK